MDELKLNDEERMAAAAIHGGVIFGFAGKPVGYPF